MTDPNAHSPAHPRRLPAFLSAVLAGAYGGITLQGGLAWSLEPDRFGWPDAGAIALLLAVYGLIALPFVALGLAVFGIPAARLLHRWRDRPWMGLVAAVCGGLAGKLAYHAIDRLLFFGAYRPWAIERADPGLCYGVPAGIAWWWFNRRDRSPARWRELGDGGNWGRQRFATASSHYHCLTRNRACGKPGSLRHEAALDSQTREQHHMTYYHGTRADLRPGDLIAAGHASNYGARKNASWVYLTGTLEAATWGAELARGPGRERIYIVEPTGGIVDDPNLTDQKFPSNPTLSYRSRAPLRVVGEVAEWQGHSPEQLKHMKAAIERLQAQGIEAID